MELRSLETLDWGAIGHGFALYRLHTRQLLYLLGVCIVERGQMSVDSVSLKEEVWKESVPRGPLYMYTKRGMCAGAGAHVHVNHSIQHA